MRHNLNIGHVGAMAAMLLLVLIAGPAAALTDTDVDLKIFGAGGYVPDGGSLEYDHFMSSYNDPTKEITAINDAWLFVAIADDWQCFSWGSCAADWFFDQETASINLNEIHWKSGQATATIFWGNVTATADLLNTNGMLHITVESSAGDFQVLWSKLVTNYEYDLATGEAGGGSGGTAPMPEPNAALVFAIGALVVRARVRRQN